MYKQNRDLATVNNNARQQQQQQRNDKFFNSFACQRETKQKNTYPSSSCCIEPSAINVDAMKCGRNESETNNIVKIKDAKITN